MKRDVERTGVFTRRALLLMGGQLAVLGTLGARLYQVQVRDGARYTTMADENRISARMIAPPRGRILDRFGTVVAGSSTNWRAVLIAEQADNVPATLDAFSALLPLSEYERARIDRELHRKRKFIPVLVREFLTWDEMATIEVNAPDLPGMAQGWPTSSATSRHRMRPTSPTIRCSACPACASAARGWRSSMTWDCADVPARCSWRSTRLAG
jgi:penicillin-binding protein 2